MPNRPKYVSSYCQSVYFCCTPLLSTVLLVASLAYIYFQWYHQDQNLKLFLSAFLAWTVNSPEAFCLLLLCVFFLSLEAVVALCIVLCILMIFIIFLGLWNLEIWTLHKFSVLFWKLKEWCRFVIYLWNDLDIIIAVSLCCQLEMNYVAFLLSRSYYLCRRLILVSFVTKVSPVITQVHTAAKVILCMKFKLH